MRCLIFIDPTYEHPSSPTGEPKGDPIGDPLATPFEALDNSNVVNFPDHIFDEF